MSQPQFKDHDEYFAYLAGLKKPKEVIKKIETVEDIPIIQIKQNPICPVCEKKHLTKNGTIKLKRIIKQLWNCTICDYSFNCPINEEPKYKHRVKTAIKKHQTVFEICPVCKEGKLIKNGNSTTGKQVYRCNNCHKKGFSISFKRKLIKEIL